MIDDNEFFSLSGDVINLSKGYLLNEAESLEKFFNDKMKKTIDFVLTFKEDINIDDYIKLPNKISYELDGLIHPSSLFKRSEMILELFNKAKSKYDSHFMEQIAFSSSKVIEKYFKMMQQKNSHIRFDVVSDFLFKGNRDLTNSIKRMNNYLFEIINGDYIKGGEVETYVNNILMKIEPQNTDIELEVYDDELGIYKDELQSLEVELQPIKDQESRMFLEKEIAKNIEFNPFLYDVVGTQKHDIDSVKKFIYYIEEWYSLLEEYHDFYLSSNASDGDADISSVVSLRSSSNNILGKWDDEMNLSWLNLSSGENAFLSIFSRLFSINNELKENVILIIDEGDMSFHPEWQKQWINVITNILEKVFKEKKFQIIVSTHSPFILSDLPSRNIMLLNDDNHVNVPELKHTFGSNIQELLANNFFINSGMTGEFSKNKINNTIDELLETNPSKRRLSEMRVLIEMIGEPLVRKKVYDLYTERANEVLNLN